MDSKQFDKLQNFINNYDLKQLVYDLKHRI